MEGAPAQVFLTRILCSIWSTAEGTITRKSITSSSHVFTNPEFTNFFRQNLKFHSLEDCKVQTVTYIGIFDLNRKLLPSRKKIRRLRNLENMWWAHTYAGYNFPLESVQKKPFTTLAMRLGGKFWVMTKVLEPVLILFADFLKY